MHDPMTVAFSIRYPWRRHGSASKFWPKGYRDEFICIWHVDPEKGGHHGNRSDDSCGWHTPPTTPEERERIRKIGEQMYSTIFNRRWAIQEGKDYARVCWEPETTYDVIYWTWRRIKHEGRKGWQFGEGLTPLTRAELQAIYRLATNPVDNLQFSVDECNSAEKCGDLFVTIYRAMLRFNRPWYRHPQWHFWHWRIQVRPWQKLHRRLFVRCAECNKPFGWNESPIGTWSGDKRWHEACDRRVNVRPPQAAPVEG